MTQTQDLVQHWLDDLGKTHGRSFRLEADGCLALEGTEGILLVLQVPDPGSLVHLNAQLGQVPAANRDTFLYQVLVLNLFQHETRGAALSIDPASNCIVLSYARPVEQLDSTGFSHLVQNLLETAGKLKKHLFDEASFHEETHDLPASALPAGALKA